MNKAIYKGLVGIASAGVIGLIGIIFVTLRSKFIKKQPDDHVEDVSIDVSSLHFFGDEKDRHYLNEIEDIEFYIKLFELNKKFQDNEITLNQYKHLSKKLINNFK